MATYKVLQDIEAEDKLLGPLTLRQFIYGLVAAFFGWLTFTVIMKGATFMAPAFLLPTLLFGFFAFPWGRDQPTEVWALAKVRFMVKPRKRIWNQDGLKELVTITVPKKVVKVYTDGLSQTEVRSRLAALATTIDSRGWAIKNAPAGYGASDRLVSASSLPHAVPTLDDRNARDMLDESDNPIATQFNAMMAASAKARREKVMERLQNPIAAPINSPVAAAPQTQQPQQPANYWFLNQPQQQTSTIPQDYVTFNTQVVEPGLEPSGMVAAATPTAEEENFIHNLNNQPLLSTNYKNHLHTIDPISVQQEKQRQATEEAARQQAQIQQMQAEQAQKATEEAARTAVTHQPDTAILDLVRNNDLDVATIAREAQKRKNNPPDEVVISLH